MGDILWLTSKNSQCYMQPVTNSPPRLAPLLYTSWQIRLDMIIILSTTGVFIRITWTSKFTPRFGKMTIHVWKLTVRTILQIHTSTSGWNNSRDQKLEFDWQHMVLWLRTIAKYFSHQSKVNRSNIPSIWKQHARNVVVLKIIQSRRQLQFRNVEGILKVQSTGKLHCFLLNLQ